MSNPLTAHIVPLAVAELVPTPESVLGQMGVPRQAAVSDRVYKTIEEAIELFSACVEPVGIISELPKDAFARIYAGEGENAEDTPLEHVFTKADSLALYALTLGSQLSEEIGKLCQSGDVALGCALDAAASIAADTGARSCENHFAALLAEHQAGAHACVLAYSPGYCGWHVSGQKKLFQALRPEQVGITLTKACLMKPIKSVSGALVAGRPEINFFKPHWHFCQVCTTHACLQRMKNLRNMAATDQDRK